MYTLGFEPFVDETDVRKRTMEPPRGLSMVGYIIANLSGRNLVKRNGVWMNVMAAGSDYRVYRVMRNML